MLPHLVASPCFGLLSYLLSFRQSPPEAAEMPDLTKTPLPTETARPEAKVTVAAGVCFLEGPAVDAEGNVFFSDIQGSRILKMDTSGTVTTFPRRQRPHQRQHVRRPGPTD